MTVPIPNLDNRSYDELREESIKMISRYFPEWTDHNPSDPGITLIELLAFLTEASIYSINFTADKTLENFGKFFGSERESDEKIEEVLRRVVENEKDISRAINEADIKSLIKSKFSSEVDRVCIVNSKNILKKIKLFENLKIKKNESYLNINANELIGCRVDYPKESIVEMFDDQEHTLYQTRLIEQFNPKKELKELKTYLTGDDKKLDKVNYVCVYTETLQSDPSDSLVKIVIFPNKSIVLTDSDKRKLCDRVYKYIKESSPVTSRLDVSIPFQENISLQVCVVFDKNSMIQSYEIKENIKKAIKKFLDPVNGGVDEKGWVIGRNLYKSELYHIIENVTGVDHVIRLGISEYERPVFGYNQFINSKLQLSLSNGYFSCTDSEDSIKIEASEE